MSKSLEWKIMIKYNEENRNKSETFRKEINCEDKINQMTYKVDKEK